MKGKVRDAAADGRVREVEGVPSSKLGEVEPQAARSVGGSAIE